MGVGVSVGVGDGVTVGVCVGAKVGRGSFKSTAMVEKEVCALSAFIRRNAGNLKND